MAFSKYAITNVGRDALLACMASGDFTIHSLVLGSGRYTGLLSEIQQLVTPEVTFPASQLSIVKREDQIEIIARLTNEQLATGFSWREYGVYITGGGDPVLYCYDNAGEDPVSISAATSGSAVSNTIKILLSVDDAATVNVTFAPAPEIAVDDAVTEGSGNPVSGGAVYAFVQDALEGMEPTWENVQDKPSTFPPAEHEHDYAAPDHDHDGRYAPASHSHSGYAASSHNHSASNITSGTLNAAGGGTGQTTIYPAVGTLGVRAIQASTTDLTAGSSSLTTGAVYLVYE